MKTRVFMTFFILLCSFISAWGQAINPVPQSLPYYQNFSDLAHASEKYPLGFMGWRAENNGTVEYFSISTPLDTLKLLPNQRADNYVGGINNYNHKIGFLNSTSVYPAIVLAINTNGKANIQVKYEISTIRNPYNGSGHTRILEATLQYRIGINGEFTTLTGIEYQNDTTNRIDKKTTPLNPESKSIQLPAECDNQPVVQLRWLARIVSGQGDCPSFAIDDIDIDGDTMTLPVTLSNFTVELTNQNHARITWVTQSENNMLGYRIYRSEDERIGNARLISGLIAACNSSQQHVYHHNDEEELAAGDYWYWIESLELGGSNQFFGPVILAISGQESGSTPGIPVKTGLGRPYPNPFNPSTQIPYSLHKDGQISFGIYNLKGQKVKTFEKGHKVAGTHQLFWDGTDDVGEECASGMYWIVMEAGKERFVEKVILMK